ncbi:MAG: thiamine pyrophosphate-binding protein [Bacteroidetes bacterium]|nr:thiamine pyrophosphate-binding protein [Bacteroidota bacterium]
MKKAGSYLVRYALEQIGVKYTFGIPGVHNTEIYDELNKSEQITPMLVTHEGGASFMADAISRTSDSIGCCVIVPAAGTTHAMSGMGEAFLDGIPMMIITGGTRTDTGRAYQLHAIDQMKIVQAVTKAAYVVEKHEDIIPTIFEAYKIAVSGEPGPVFIEIPANLQLFKGDVRELPEFSLTEDRPPIYKDRIKKAVDILLKSEHPCLYVGWGSVDTSAATVEIAEILGAPVSTSLQGKSAFPNHHPLYTGVGFGASGKPAAQNAFAKCDAMLAVGVRFSELGTGSYGIAEPKNLVHIDINSDVFDKNYKSVLSIQADSRDAMPAILAELKSRNYSSPRNVTEIREKIRKDEEKYMEGWLTEKKPDMVSPAHFFQSLQKQVNEEAMMVVDDGKHTFLAAELFQAKKPRHFISPTDFNCMGYCVPASIATKLANPDNQVIAIVGDGAFMMTCMELMTASTYGIAPMVFVFHDGELGQISQFQSIPLKHKTCTVLGNLKIEGVALAVGAHFIGMNNDNHIDEKIAEAIKVSSEGKPVIVDVNIDYSKKTMLTKGVIKTNLKRFPLGEKIRFLSRAAKRHVLG